MEPYVIPQVDNRDFTIVTDTVLPRPPDDGGDMYKGCNGRPDDSLERIMTSHHVPVKLVSKPGARNLAARKIQRMQKYWTAPRLRSRRYDPLLPNVQKGAVRAPGSTRLPGYELTTREGIALQYLLENGRLLELLRSLSQLRERGATLTENTYLMLLGQARRLGEPAIAGAVLSFAEDQRAWLSDRSFSQVILAYTEIGNLELAEAFAKRALRVGCLPGPRALVALAKLGSYTETAWRARWRLQLLNQARSKKTSLPRETVALVILRGQSPFQKVLVAPHALLGFQQYPNEVAEPTSPDLEELVKDQMRRVEKHMGQFSDDLRNRVSKMISERPEGHDTVQLDLPITPLADEIKWQDPTCLLSPKACWWEPRLCPALECERVHLRVWSIKVSSDDELFQCKKVLTWQPVDEAVWSLSRVDALGLLSDVLIETVTADHLTDTEQKMAVHDVTARSSLQVAARVLVACEESLVFSQQLKLTGLPLSVMSVDLVPPEFGGYRHLCRDATTLLKLGSWHGMVAFPPCQFLANCAGLYLERPGRRKRMERAVAFFKKLYDAPIPLIALENPKQSAEARRMLTSEQVPGPSLTLHPWQHEEMLTKPTQLWLKGGLSPPKPSENKSTGRVRVLAHLTPSPVRTMVRSRTFSGIARAMATTWAPEFLACVRGQRWNAEMCDNIKTAIAASVVPVPIGTLTDDSQTRGAQTGAEEIHTMLKIWKRYFPDPHHAKATFEKAGAALRLACKAAEVENNCAPVNLVFRSWKRESELRRGRLFGNEGVNVYTIASTTSKPAKPLWIIAQQLLRENRAWVRKEEADDQSAEKNRPLPLPPIRRLVKRAGQWWAWVPQVTSAGDEEYRHSWRKLPENAQGLLNETSEAMRPTVAALYITPLRAIPYSHDECHARATWKRVANGLLKTCQGMKGYQLSQQHKNTKELSENVKLEVLAASQKCTDCGKIRDAAGGCPRGLGSDTCKQVKPNKNNSDTATAVEKRYRTRSLTDKELRFIVGEDRSQWVVYTARLPHTPPKDRTGESEPAYLCGPSSHLRACNLSGMGTYLLYTGWENARVRFDRQPIGQHQDENHPDQTMPGRVVRQLSTPASDAPQKDATPVELLLFRATNAPRGRAGDQQRVRTKSNVRLGVDGRVYLTREVLKLDLQGAGSWGSLGLSELLADRRNTHWALEKLDHNMLTALTITAPGGPNQVGTPHRIQPVIAAVRRVEQGVSEPLSTNWREVMVDPTCGPDLKLLSFPKKFGEEDVSRTEPEKMANMPQCAWLDDVMVCTKNTEDQEGRIPYLMGNVGVWNPAAMGDTGAGVSLIGSLLLESLPKGAVARFQPAPLFMSNVSGPDGGALNILGSVSLLITISRVPFEHVFHIVRGSDLLLLGSDFLTPRHGDVCLRPDQGDGCTGYCALTHPRYGRIRLPLTATPGGMRNSDRPLPIGAVLAPKKDPPAQSVAHQLRVHTLFNTHASKVAARSDRVIMCRLPDVLQNPPYTGNLLIKPLEKKVGDELPVEVSWAVAKGRRSEFTGDELLVPVKIINTCHHPITVPALTPLAEVETHCQVEETEAADFNADEQAKVLREVTIDPQNVLTAHQTEAARAVVGHHYRAFAQDPSIPGKTHSYKVTLDLKEGAKPFRHSPPRLGVEARRFVEQHIADLQRNGLIQRTNESSFASRIVLVGKKDGTLRLCVDYRSLNKLLHTVSSPLPRVEQCLMAMSEGMYQEPEPEKVLKNKIIPTAEETAVAPGDVNGTREDVDSITPVPSNPSLPSEVDDVDNWHHPEEKKIRASGGHGPKYWCVCDLAQGFFGMGLDEKSKPLTTFVTPFGAFFWNVCPFGLQSAPSHCQSMMDQVMSGLSNVCCVYLDDCISWGRTFEEMVERVGIVLSRFEQAGLTLKSSKCSFFCTEVSFLGHIVSRYGVAPDPAKVKAIKEVNPDEIKTLHDIRSYLGCAGYYRKFQKDFGTMARPLTDCTRKGVDLAVQIKTPEVQDAIRQIQQSLVSAPTLAMPQWGKQWVVHSDASCVGLGAMLCQEDDEGKEHPVCFWSRVLTPCEARWGISEIELLGIVSCIAHWRHYLWSYLGKPFILLTDHSALLYLAQAKDLAGGGPASRLQRWYLKLQSYNFETRHRAGRLHYIPDWLSRNAGDPEYKKLLEAGNPEAWAQAEQMYADTQGKRSTMIPATGDAGLENGGENQRVNSSFSKSKNEVKQPLNIIFKKESLIATTAQVLAHQCNCTAIRPKGLTAKIFKTWPGANTYKDRAENGHAELGSYSLHQRTPETCIVNLYAQNDVKPALNREEWVLRRDAIKQASDTLMTDKADISTLALPAAIGLAEPGKTDKHGLSSIFEWALRHPSTQVWLHQPEPLKSTPTAVVIETRVENDLKDDENVEKSEAVLDDNPTRPEEECIVIAASRPVSSLTAFKPVEMGLMQSDQLVQRLLDLSEKECESTGVEEVARLMREGSILNASTVESIISQLAEEGLARMAAEILEAAVHAEMATKKGHFLVLKALHKAGMPLQVAPVLRRLNVNYGFEPIKVKHAIADLEIEFCSCPQTRAKSRGYQRYTEVTKVIFLSTNGERAWCHSRELKVESNQSETFDLPGGKAEATDGTLSQTLRRELQEELGRLPPTVQAKLEEEMRNFPLGHSRAKVHPGRWYKMHIISVWAVVMPSDELFSFKNLEPNKHYRPEWRKVGDLLSNLYGCPKTAPFARAVEKAIRRRNGFRLPLTVDYMPWPKSSGETPSDVPALEQTKQVQCLRSQLQQEVVNCRSWEDYQGLQNVRRRVAAVCLYGTRRETVAAVPSRLPREKSSPGEMKPTPLAKAARSVFDVWKQYAVKTLPHTQELRNQQMNDLWVREIMDHLLSEYVPPNLSGPAAKRFCALASEYTIRDGLLFRLHSDPRLRRAAYQLAVPVTFRDAFLEAFHDRLGHLSAERTYQALRVRVYWPGMKDDVVRHVHACHECSIAKKPVVTYGQTMLPPIASRPFDLVVADILSLPESNAIGPLHLKYQKIIIFCDNATRWVEAVMLPSDPTAEEVLDAFIQNVVCRYGVPRCLVCDRGSNLIAQLCDSVYTLLGVDLRPSTAYRHQTAGLVERFNRSLQGLIRAAGDPKDWPLHVPFLCFYYRATPHAVTKMSPAMLNYGRELRLPHDQMILPGIMSEQPSIEDTRTYSALQVEKRLKLAWDEAGRLSIDAQYKGKERRDLTLREPAYEADQWVLLRRPPNDHTGNPKGGKLAPIFDGPYRIEAILARGNVRLRDLPRKIHNEVHVSRLRPYTPHDEVPVAQDEFKVKTILRRRGSAAAREYLVHWFGYPKTEATWEPSTNLLTRCFDMVSAYDASIDKSKSELPPVGLEREPSPNDSTVEDAENENLSKGQEEPTQSTEWEVGQRALVPAHVYPQERCTERNGQGWMTRIEGVGTEDGHCTAFLKFTHAKDNQGRPYANVTLRTSVLTHPEGGQVDMVAPDDASTFLSEVCKPTPATAAKIINGVWHYERVERNEKGKGFKRFVEEAFFSPAELEQYEPLRQDAVKVKRKHVRDKENMLSMNPGVAIGRLRSSSKPPKALPPPVTDTSSLRRTGRFRGPTVGAVDGHGETFSVGRYHLPDNQLLARTLLDKGPGVQAWQALTATLRRASRACSVEAELLKEKLYESLSTRDDLSRFTQALMHQFWENSSDNPRRIIQRRDDTHGEDVLLSGNDEKKTIDASQFEWKYGPQPLEAQPEYEEAMICLALRALRHRSPQI